MGIEIIDAFKLIDERHRLSVRWLAEFQETHEGQSPIGLVIRCIDSRLYRIMSTDSINRIIGKVLEYKTMGNTIDINNAKDRAVLIYFAKHLSKNIIKHGLRGGFILVEGHSDCGAVRLAHENGPGIVSRYMKDALKSILATTEYVFYVLKRNPNLIFNAVESMVSEATLSAKTDLRKRFYPEMFYEKGVIEILRKQINPTKASMALHFYICLINAMVQIFRILLVEDVRRHVEEGKLRLLVSLYDIFSAKTYYFVADHYAILNELYRHSLNEAMIYALGKNIIDFFEEI